MDAEPSEKRTMLSEALSNSTLLDRNIVEVRYQSPYNIFAIAPLNPTFQEMLAGMGKVRTPEVPEDLVPIVDQLLAVLRSEETQQRLATIRVIRDRVEGQRARAA